MKIVKIFSSIQGEGSFSGYPTVFVRLSGCNLNCNYCDTKESRTMGIDIDPHQVETQVLLEGHHHVCITGGEPLLQKIELISLLHSLQGKSRSISIETNGTISFKELQQYAHICMDVKCPSSEGRSDLSLLTDIREMDSVKFVIGTVEDLHYARDVIQNYQIMGEIFFSPVFGSDYSEIISYILEKRLNVRFQLQLHKIIGVK